MSSLRDRVLAAAQRLTAAKDEYERAQLSFDTLIGANRKKNGSEPESPALRYQAGGLPQRTFEAIASGVTTTAALVKHLKANPASVRSVIIKLHRDGAIKRVKRGVWKV